MEKFGKFCFGVLSIITRSLLSGYAFMKLWGWFIIGLVFFWGYLKPKKKDEDEFTWEKFIKEFVEDLLLVGVVLGLGYLITLFQ